MGYGRVFSVSEPKLGFHELIYAALHGYVRTSSEVCIDGTDSACNLVFLTLELLISGYRIAVICRCKLSSGKCAQGSEAGWRSLKTAIDNRGIRIVSVDLPTSHQGMTAQSGDEFTDRMLAAINYMMIDMMAAIARKDYQQRRLRQAQGIEKA
ncbi:putative resolvase, partial [Pseudomonas amygdali pv. myricae]